MRRGSRGAVAGARAAPLLLLAAAPAGAHSGPPFPIVSDRLVGAYRISVWTDPDATDDGTAAGRFWVIVETASGAEAPADTRVTVAARPLDRRSTEQRTSAAAEPASPSRYFASLTLDHEANWQVVTMVDGPLGSATSSDEVAATYDLRPSIGSLPFLLLPFLLVGFLWLTALRKRRRISPREIKARSTGDQ